MSRVIPLGNNEIETVIDRFDVGITNDPRDTRDGVNQVITNFDILTNPRKITPYRNSEDGHSAGSTTLMRNWCIGINASGGYSLYGLGRQTANDRPLIQYKDLTTGASTDLDDNGWAETANNTSARTTTSYNLFVFYRKTAKIYGAHSGYIYAYDPTGSAAITVGEQALTYTHITQGIVHSEDDILYVGGYNSAGSAGTRSFILANNNGSWDTSALALPDHLIPTSVFESGNWLGIVCADVNGVGSSKLILWDRDSISWNEMYDLGEGSAIIGEDLQGTIVTLSQSGGTVSSFTGIPSSVRHKNKLTIKFFPSTGSDTIELEGGTSNELTLPLGKQKINNRLYFQMSIILNGTVREGLWSIGRNKQGQWALVHERTPNNDTALTSGIMRGFFILGDYVFQAYVDNGTYAVSKTNDEESYATSIIETVKYNAGDSSKKKDLLGFSVMTDPLDDSPAASVVVKYKKDNESSYTTFMTHDTDGAISDSAVNTEATGAVLPKDYKEISFRIESTGAVITGYSFREKITNKRPYN